MRFWKQKPLVSELLLRKRRGAYIVLHTFSFTMIKRVYKYNNHFLFDLDFYVILRYCFKHSLECLLISIFNTSFDEIYCFVFSRDGFRFNKLVTVVADSRVHVWPEADEKLWGNIICNSQSLKR